MDGQKEIYSKHDAVMTHGLAIICMLLLHLFCRKGTDVLHPCRGPVLYIYRDEYT